MLIGRAHFLRLAGVSSILGLDMNEDRAHIVEIAFRAAPHGRQTGKFRIQHTLSVDFLPGEPESDRIAKTREAVFSSGMKARHVASSLNTIGVRIAMANVPITVDDIPEWIEENAESILKLPITLSDLTISHQILPTAGTARKVRIVFVRRKELETHLQAIEAIGLEPVCLSAGLLDLRHLSLLIPGFSTATEVVHFGRHGATICSFNGDGEESWGVNSASTSDFSPTAELPGNNRILVGDLPQGHEQQIDAISGIERKHALALCSAVGAVGNTPTAMDLLPSDRHNATGVKLGSLLFKRAVLAAGIVVFVLLGFPFLVSSYVGAKIEALEEDESAIVLAQVEMLEEELSVLKGKLLGEKGILNRTSAARVMHEVVTTLPDSLWLRKLKFEAEATDLAKVSMEGRAHSLDHVSKFLRRLAENPTTNEARLIRTGVKETKGATLERLTRGETEFEIEARIKM